MCARRTADDREGVALPGIRDARVTCQQVGAGAPPQLALSAVDRVLDLNHGSRLDQIDAALAADGLAGAFRNGAAGGGVDATGWNWSAQFGDPDNEGDLDPYTANGTVGEAFGHLPGAGLQSTGWPNACADKPALDAVAELSRVLETSS